MHILFSLVIVSSFPNYTHNQIKNEYKMYNEKVVVQLCEVKWGRRAGEFDSQMSSRRCDIQF